MKALKLHSCLAAQIQSFISLRQLSGTDYHSQAQLLEYFDRFVVQEKIHLPRITPKITEDYQRTFSHLTPRGQSNRLCVVRQLCEYLSRTDPLTHVPEPLRTITPQAAHRPYIFNQTDITALLSSALRLGPPQSLRPQTYRTLLGLLYCTGMRIGEALALNLKDFYSDEKRLYIAEGKFHKARWVPLSACTCQALNDYMPIRAQMAPRSSDSPLFVNQRGRRLHHCTVNQTFRRLLKQCAIAHNKRTGPRIHDLRHTFAVHRLLAWYRDGADVNARLPWLATYMGHVDIASTHVYLNPTAELLEEVGTRFRSHYLQRVQTQGERS
jgi:site-specific recombinase XerD